MAEGRSRGKEQGEGAEGRVEEGGRRRTRSVVSVSPEPHTERERGCPFVFAVRPEKMTPDHIVLTEQSTRLTKAAGCGVMLSSYKTLYIYIGRENSKTLFSSRPGVEPCAWGLTLEKGAPLWRELTAKKPRSAIIVITFS